MMNQNILQLIFFLLPCVFIHEVLNVKLESDKSVPVKVKNLLLSCLTSSLFNSGIIYWYNPSGIEMSRCYPIYGGMCDRNTSSYSFTANISGAYAYIDILDRTSDAGKWKCVQTFREKYTEMDTKDIVIYDGAKITNLSVVERDTVNENGTVTLSCSVDSKPESNITWTKNGTEAPLKIDLYVLQSHLVINGAQCLDTSNYTCQASNGVDSPAERRIPLHVNCHPRTDFRSPPVTKVYSKRRGDANLRYTVISYPDPTFAWTFVGNGSERKALPNNSVQNDFGQHSTLMFTNLDLEDFGLYSVTAENPFPPSATELFELAVAAENISHTTEMRLLFVGVAALLVLCIVVVISVCVTRRRRCLQGTCKKQGEDSSQNNELCAESSPVISNPVRSNEVSGEHEDMRVKTNDDSLYSEIYDIVTDYSASASISLSEGDASEGDAYEKLHMYANANSQDNTYSSVKPPTRIKVANLLFRRYKDKKMKIPPTTMLMNQIAQNK